MHISKHLDGNSRVTNGALPAPTGSDVAKTSDRSSAEQQGRAALTRLGATSTTVTSRGAYLSEIRREEPVGNLEFAFLADLLTRSFGIDHTEPDTDPFDRVKLVVELAREKRWGALEFRRAATEFVARQKFPTWTVADFFEIDRPRVYDYRWMVAQLDKGTPASELACYSVDGQPVWGRRHEIGDQLEPFDWKVTVRGELSESNATGPDPETRAAWDAEKERLRLAAELDDARIAVNRLQRELEEERRLCDAYRAEIERLRLDVRRLEVELDRRDAAHG